MKGQSLVELIIAVGIFVAVIGAVGLLLLRGYLADFELLHRSQANFLAREGLETARGIRDSDWQLLSEGSHGLAILNNQWVFQGTEEDIAGKLEQGKRQVVIENITEDRKRVVSKVSWQNVRGQTEQVVLTTFLTNWQKITVPEYACQGTALPCSSFAKKGPCQKQAGCTWQAGSCLGEAVACDNYSTEADCLGQLGCQWVSG